MINSIGVNNIKSVKTHPNFKNVAQNKSVSFSSSFDKDSFDKSEFNYERLSILIHQQVPMKKMTKLYNQMMDDSDESTSLYVKLMTLKTKVIGSLKRKLSPEQADKDIIDGCSQAIGMLIPESLKIPKNENLFDIPYEVNTSIITIINEAENFDQFYDAIEKYTRYMDKYGYNADSDLPTVTGLKTKRNRVTLEFDKELRKQEN